MRTVLRFLQVDDTYPFEALDVHATTSSIRSQQLDDVLLAVSAGHGPLSQAGRRMLKLIAPRRLRRGAFTLIRRRVVFADAPPPDERLMIELRRRFKPEVEAVSEYLGRDLVTLWGYDRLD